MLSKFLFRSQQQNRREIRMAYLTFAIVTLFFLLNLPRIALGGYEVSNTWLILRCVAKGSKYLSTLTFYRWDTISRLLMVINSSINFLIYCAGSQQFKVTLHSYSWKENHSKSHICIFSNETFWSNFQTVCLFFTFFLYPRRNFLLCLSLDVFITWESVWYHRKRNRKRLFKLMEWGLRCQKMDMIIMDAKVRP